VKYLGTVPTQPQPLAAKCEMQKSVVFEYTSAEFQEFCHQHAGDYVVSNSTADHLDRSIRKVDAPVCHKFRDDPHFVEALSFVQDMFDVCFRAPEMEPYRILDEVVMDSSAGVIFAQMGLPKKGDVIRANLHNSEFSSPDFDKDVIWKVSGKVEPRLRSDYVGEKKQRTFIIEPFDHLWHTKREYGMQNVAMKNHGWSAYGFNPYEGGVNRLAHLLAEHDRHIMLDGKGWDRILPHMREVYALRNLYKKPSPLLDWTYRNLICSILVCPNGDVIYKEWGNNSGSGNTTCDNILAMSICLSHVYLYLGYTPEEIRSNVFVAVFGDDVVASDSFGCSDEELEAAYHHVFTNLYGVVLDPFVITRSICDLTFLGFAFAKYHDWYIPCYPLSKLCASAKGNVKGMTVDGELGKLTSLMLMSAGHGKAVFDFFRNAVLDVISHSESDFCNQLRLLDLDKVVPTFYVVIGWYVGWEGIHMGSFESLYLNDLMGGAGPYAR